MKAALFRVACAATIFASATGAYAADHLEARGVQETPTADINDIYAFRSPSQPSRVVLIMTVNPLSDPDFAGTYAFSPDVLYRFSISNAGGSQPELNIDFLFEPVVGGVQTYTAFTPVGRITGQTTAPTTAAQPNAPLSTRQDGVRIFAGPRDDPFFFDNVGFSRFLNGGDFRGVDGFGEFNVSAIVIELPRRLLRGEDGGSAIEVTGVSYTAAQSSLQADLGAPTRRRAGRTFFQADRMGVPGLASVLVPLDQRDAFNFAPIQDGGDAFAGIDFTSVIVSSLQGLGATQANIDILASVAVPDTLKIDLSQPSGFPNGRRPQDDVIDTLLSLILDNPSASDLVDANDARFRNQFPYLAPPQQP